MAIDTSYIAVKDYFSKWPFAQAIPDWNTERIVCIHNYEPSVHSCGVTTHKLYSNYCKAIYCLNLCKAFKVHTWLLTILWIIIWWKEWITHFLGLLHTFSQKSSDWEETLCLYTEPPNTHQRVCLHMNYFILQSTTIHIQKLHITAILDYSTNLNQKPLVIRELVDAIKNILCSAEQQQHIIMAKHQWSKGKKGQLLEVGQAAGVWQS